ncbi:MAG: VOC family protein [Mangrovicoccus sp.]|nr:VOC family protein [Mangrovicoccus sp.]
MSQPRLARLDHLVLTVADPDATCDFYAKALGMEPIRFTVADGSQRQALRFGDQKINLHRAGSEFAPHAKAPVPGSADLCFLSDQPLQLWQAHFAQCGIEIEDGPVPRSGAIGPIYSLYIRDLDGNLIEIANRV